MQKPSHRDELLTTRAGLLELTEVETDPVELDSLWQDIEQIEERLELSEAPTTLAAWVGGSYMEF